MFLWSEVLFLHILHLALFYCLFHFIHNHSECCDHSLSLSPWVVHCLLVVISVTTSHPWPIINDCDVSSLHDDDNDTTVMTAVRSLLLPTVVIIDSHPLFLDETNKNEHVPPTSSSSSLSPLWFECSTVHFHCWFSSHLPFSPQDQHGDHLPQSF